MSVSSASDTGYIPQHGDIVWAQMKPWKPWPGKVEKPPKGEKVPDSKKNSFYIYFFGSNNYGWVPCKFIWPYEEFKEKYNLKYKMKDFVAGVKTADEKCEAKKKVRSEVPRPNEEEQKTETAVAAGGSTELPENTSPEAPPEKKKKKGTSPEALPEKKKKKGKVLAVKIIKKDLDRKIVKKAKRILKSTKESGSSSKKARLVKSGKRKLIPRSAGHSSRLQTLPPTEPDAPVKIHTVGVLGLGALGDEVVMSLLKVGHQVTVWNRTASKCAKYVELGAKVGETPGEVFKSCDVTLICVSSADAVKFLVFMNNGINATADKGCNLVVLTNMNAKSSTDVEDVIVRRGARYLEAPVYRIDQDEARTLTVLAAGDEGIFHDFESVFKAFAKKCFYLGQTGKASKAVLVLNSFMGSVVAGMAEAMSLAERTGVMQSELLNVISVSPLNSKFLLDKGKAMLEKDFSTHMPLQHLTDAMEDTLSMSLEHKHSMPVAAAAKEMYVSAAAMNFGDRDMSAVYMPARY